jgi:transcriptional regulator with XRE-family HTH domain
MKLQEYRKQEKLTLVELAQQVGVTEVAISRYERGERLPRPSVMRKIEEVTGGLVRPNDFLSEAA